MRAMKCPAGKKLLLLLLPPPCTVQRRFASKAIPQVVVVALLALDRLETNTFSVNSSLWDQVARGGRIGVSIPRFIAAAEATAAAEAIGGRGGVGAINAGLLVN